ncbi:hypothetical protein EIP86_007319 [Pleurotus ostreatoroseus]|nr:hypothetical protein EIP86_007319 [Pleurotus ostreatoroseus]
MPLPKSNRISSVLDEDDDFMEDWNESSEKPHGSSNRSPKAQDEKDFNPAKFAYRRWAIPAFAQKQGYPADATDRKSLRHVPFPRRRPRPRHKLRRWDLPRLVRSRHETRRYRRHTRLDNKKFRRNVLGIKKRPLFWWYTLKFPPSFFEPRGGFLYLYTPPPGLPDTAVGLRFRITNDKNPKSFIFGRDLTYQGVPWTIPLHYGPIRNKVIRHLLFKDNLVPLPVMRRCSSLRRKLIRQLAHRSKRYKRIRKAVMQKHRGKHRHPYELHRDVSTRVPLIYALGQPFCVDFSVPSMRICVLGTKGSRDEFHHFRLGLPKLYAGLTKKPRKIKRWEAEQKKLEIKRAKHRKMRAAYRARKRAQKAEAADAGLAVPAEGEERPPEEFMDWQDYERKLTSDRRRSAIAEEISHDDLDNQTTVPADTKGIQKPPPPPTPPSSRPNNGPPATQVVALRVIRVIDRVKPVPDIWIDKPVPPISSGALLPFLDPFTLEGGPWYWPRPDRPRNALIDTLLSLPKYPKEDDTPV